MAEGGTGRSPAPSTGQEVRPSLKRQMFRPIDPGRGFSWAIGSASTARRAAPLHRGRPADPTRMHRAARVALQCSCFGRIGDTMAAMMASRAASSSKGSEALRLVFSRIDAGCGNRRGRDGRPNGPCKAMCFLSCSIIPGGLRPVTAPSRRACRSFPDGCACRATRKGESDARPDPTA